MESVYCVICKMFILLNLVEFKLFILILSLLYVVFKSEIIFKVILRYKMFNVIVVLRLYFNFD